VFQKASAATGAVLFVLGAGAVFSQNSTPEPKLPFASGEKLRYEVQWRLVPAGEAELLVGREESPTRRWKVTAKATSIGYVSNIYKVDDEYQSISRNTGLCSSEIRKTINEGERHRLQTILFGQRLRLAIMTDRAAAGGEPPRLAQSSIPDCVHDILSAIYLVRTRPLTVGQSMEIPINDGSRTVPLRIDVQAKEEIKTKLGVFHTIRVEPDVFSGKLYKDKGRMFLWFSDDAKHLPVQFRAQISVGTITASLTAIEETEGKP